MHFYFAYSSEFCVFINGYINVAFIYLIIFLSFLQELLAHILSSCLIIATCSYCICTVTSWFVKLYKLMEACFYFTVIFFSLYGLFLLFFPLLYFLMLSASFFIISHLWMWRNLTRWLNYRIVIGKVNSTGFPDNGDPPQFTWKFLMTQDYMHFTNCFFLFFNQQDLKLQESSWFRISSQTKCANLFPVWAARLSASPPLLLWGPLQSPWKNLTPVST